MPEVDEDPLWAHLITDFGEFGQRSVDFLRTAAALLASGFSAPRCAEAVCYCVREALKELPKAAGIVPRPLWRQASREVVEARRRYQIAAQGPDATAALADLLQSIDDLESAHHEEPIHQQRLVAMMARRAGTKPAIEPVEEYQRLISTADKLAHGSATADEARAVYEAAGLVVRQLFLPPEARLPELAELAAAEAPTGSDAARLLALVATPQHLDYFYGRAVSIDWLRLLDDSPLVVPPNGNEPWSVRWLVERLKDAAPEQLADWLRTALERWGGQPGAAFAIANAALTLGSHGFEVVLSALRRHLGPVAYLALRLVDDVDPADQVVLEVADCLLGAAVDIDMYARGILGTALREGVTSENWARRVEVAVYKLLAATRDRDSSFGAVRDRGGSIADIDDTYEDELSSVLLDVVIGVLGAAQSAGAPVDALLDAVERLPDEIRTRLRAWLLGRYPDVAVELLVEEVAVAIATREPTGDDVPLIDRVVAAAPEGFADRWKNAIGPPPTVEAVGAGLARHDLNESWYRARWWTALLPEAVTNSWAKVNAVLAGAYGVATRDAFTERRQAEAGIGHSPVSEEELSKLGVLEAARWVAAWRPDPAEWLVGSRELARVLEAVVKKNAGEWTADPLVTVSTLREPIYVAHYFRGLATTEGRMGANVADLVEVVAFTRTHPWTATPLGNDRYDYDPTWEAADNEAVALLQRLAAQDEGFGGRTEQAWRLVLDSAVQTDEPSSYDEPMTGALNRGRTRALEAVFSLMGWEHRTIGSVRPEALDVIDAALRLEGMDGAQHRAVIVPRLPFLLAIAPTWVTERRSVFFGDAAPPGLASGSIDLFVKWGHPNRWLFENERESLREAVGRDGRKASAFWLIAMLWGVEGYSVSETVDLFAGLGDARLSGAAEALGRLLRGKEVEPAHVTVAVAFADELLARNSPGSVAGLGWFAEVKALDDDRWLRITIEAARVGAGRLMWGRRVAERAATTRSVGGLRILNSLVTGLQDEWDRATVHRSALGALREAPDLKETEEYRKLRSTLLERGVFGAESL